MPREQQAVPWHPSVEAWGIRTHFIAGLEPCRADHRPGSRFPILNPGSTVPA